MILKALPITLLFLTPVLAQQTGAATTRGTCSPAMTGNNNTFTFNCGIGKEQGEAILGIVNRILASQIDPAAVMVKLDEILKEIKARNPLRDIPAGKRAGIAERLRAFRGTPLRFSNTTDREAEHFSDILGEVLNLAQWTGDWKPVMVTGTVPSGFIIRAQSAQLAAARALEREMKEIGIDVTFFDGPTQGGEGKVNVLIGPPPIR